MKVFRLQNKKYPIELSGVGAARFGARWNSKGTEIIYTAESRALAMSEVVVHLTLAALPKSFCMVTILIPDEIKIVTLNSNELDSDWNSFPETVSTQTIGDHFIRKNEFCVMKVPSAVVKNDFNFLINTHHPDFKKIEIIHQEDFPFDRRIFKTF